MRGGCAQSFNIRGIQGGCLLHSWIVASSSAILSAILNSGPCGVGNLNERIRQAPKLDYSNDHDQQNWQQHHHLDRSLPCGTIASWPASNLSGPAKLRTVV
jgi:hypothetical protein